MKRFALVAVLLTACSTMQPCPPPPIQTVTVKEPTPAACIDPSAIPGEPPMVAIPLNDARLAADVAAAQASDLRRWGRSLMALIGPCEKTP